MKYYKLLTLKGYEKWEYQFKNNIPLKENELYPTLNTITVKDCVRPYPEDWQEVSKHEYLLFKVKELKDKILNKSNGFYVEVKDINKWNIILKDLKLTSNIEKGYDRPVYLELLSDNTWDFRGFISDMFIKQYNLNLIIFEDLINELKDINNEI